MHPFNYVPMPPIQPASQPTIPTQPNTLRRLASTDSNLHDNDVLRGTVVETGNQRRRRRRMFGSGHRGGRRRRIPPWEKSFTFWWNSTLSGITYIPTLSHRCRWMVAGIHRSISLFLTHSPRLTHLVNSMYVEWQPSTHPPILSLQTPLCLPPTHPAKEWCVIHGLIYANVS